MHSYDVLIWIGALFSLLFLFAFSLKFFGFPYIFSFMLVGLIGKIVFQERVIDWLAFLEHSAIVFMFFFIGLEYSFERLGGMKRTIKPGLIDFLVNFVPIFALSYIFTRDLIFSSVIASALYPSSTAITAKLLSDYRRLVLPDAELLIGILIFEDLVSIILLSLLEGGLRFLSIIPVLFGFYLLRGLVRKLMGTLDKLSEDIIFPFFVVGVLLLLCGLGEKMGVSAALIAFLLGVMVPEESPTFRVIEERLLYLKELALGVFFFSFTYNTRVTFNQNFYLALALIFLSQITKLVSTYWGARIYGLSKKSSLRTSLSFLARGEFSLIFAGLLPDTQSLIFFVVLVTSFLGSLSFVYAPKIASYLIRSKG